MANSVLSDTRFHNEEAAFAYVEAQLWPNGPVCPHCGKRTAPRLAVFRARRPARASASATPAGSRSPSGSAPIFEDSHLPLRLWLQAIHLLCASKKGISTRQLQRTLGAA